MENMSKSDKKKENEIEEEKIWEDLLTKEAL